MTDVGLGVDVVDRRRDVEAFGHRPGIVRQASPPPPRIHATLIAVAERLDRIGARWIVTGSTARALLGSGERPEDLDIEVAGSDAARAAAALGLTLARDTSNGWTSDRGVGRVAQVAVDLSANVVVAGRSPEETDALSSPILLTLGRLTFSVISPATARARGR